MLLKAIWITLILLVNPPSTQSAEREDNQNTIEQTLNYKQTIGQKTNLKYILLWTTEYMPFFPPFRFFGVGQKVFYNNNCSCKNCYITRNKKLFNGKLNKFSAILFNIFHIQYSYTDKSLLPILRHPRQKYIFVSQESHQNYLLCNDYLDNFFNWTQTYRLDSDIPLPYIGVRNNGKTVGPKIGMEWTEDYGGVGYDLDFKLSWKHKPVAWFVSHCTSQSNREVFVLALQKELNHYGMAIDIYGKCGNFQCQHYKHDSEHVLQSRCDLMLERYYFFYLALENSFALDYITEKVLRPLMHYTVPIVYGGAEYSRFLPPGSYIDALNQTVGELALIIYKSVKSRDIYKQFFAWRNNYTIYDPRRSDNACALCSALNNKTKFKTPSFYPSFRYWWDPDYKNRCELRDREKGR